MINYSCQDINHEDEKAVLNALRAEILTGGDKVSEFEEALCKYTGSKYAVVCNSATSALHLAYLVLDLRGKVVLSTPISFVATTSMVYAAGGVCEFVDINKDGNIDANTLKIRLAKGGVSAVCSVDFAGNPVEYAKIKTLCDEAGVVFISDASHSLGASYNGQKVGSLADMSIFSFHPIKPITTLEGGAVLTNNYNYYQKMKRLRSHGLVREKEYENEIFELGFNYRLSDVACALGLSQLKRLDENLFKRQKIVDFYNEAFANESAFDTICVKKTNISSNHLYPLIFHKKWWDKKEEIKRQMLNNKISVQIHYKPIYQYAFYKQKHGEISLYNAECFYKSELSLKANSRMDIKEASKIVKTLRKILTNI